jgi:hypothetical protein
VNGTAHAGLAVLALVFVAAVVVVRYAVTPAPAVGRHRPVRVRPVEEYVPGGYLIPALAVHGSAHRCDQHGHITIHTRTGDHR